MKFVDVKINQTALKSLNEEENGQSKNEGFEDFEKVILLLLQTFLEIMFFNR